MARLLDFSDGFESSSEPSQGTLNANSLQSHVDDAAFVVVNGAAVEGSIYFNSTFDRVRAFDGSTWVNTVSQSDPVVFETDVQTLTNKDLTDGTNTFPTTLATLTGIEAFSNKDLTSGTNTFPSTLATLTGTQLLTNKTISGTNNTITIKAEDIDSDGAPAGQVPISDGANGTAFGPIAATVNSFIYFNTGNGHGSTNTNIRRISTLISSNGGDISHADTAADGTTFTINTTGLYFIAYSDNGPGFRHGVSLNSAQLTTDVASITAADLLCFTEAVGADTQQASCVRFLTATDILRPHTDASPNSSDLRCWFLVSRIA